MQLSENHEIIRDIARRFTEEQIVPIAAELDVEGRYPEENMKALAEMGFLGVNVPEGAEAYASAATPSMLLLLRLPRGTSIGTRRL